ncbi:hypothetical protein SASPL_153986 [Salvia splendens]|uniref:Uncharacterized protein n=1 Tax=Salvia splendens TaxID=180675 RepID=A0A8X8VZA8_SALSN|nr:hypothetical protein SASPL_153986 [Salvia splendens]
MQHFIEDYFPDEAQRECTTVVRQLMYNDTLDQFDSCYTSLTQRTNNVSRIRSWRVCKGLWFRIKAGLRSLDGDEKEKHGDGINGSDGDSTERVSPLWIN